MKENIEFLSHCFQEFFLSKGMSSDLAIILNIVITSIIFISIIYILDVFAKKMIIQVFKIFSDKTKNIFDDYLIASKFPKYFAHLFILLLALYFIPILYNDFPISLVIIVKIVNLYSIILIIFIARSVLRSIKAFVLNKERFKDKPLDSYMQVLMIMVWE